MLDMIKKLILVTGILSLVLIPLIWSQNLLNYFAAPWDQSLRDYFGFETNTTTQEFVASSSNRAVREPIKEVVERVIAPSPIQENFKEAITSLSRVGVIHWTNTQRILNNLPVLKENSLLDKAASVKASDLLARQYFAHISPTGQGIATVVSAQGYDYAVIGENLALGRFENDKALV